MPANPKLKRSQDVVSEELDCGGGGGGGEKGVGGGSGAALKAAEAALAKAARRFGQRSRVDLVLTAAPGIPRRRVVPLPFPARRRRLLAQAEADAPMGTT